MYIGVDPFKESNLYTLIPTVSKLYGIWYIKGGMYAYIKALEKLIYELGGKIKRNTEVDEILIENYKNILEYQDVLIKINTFEGSISIYGFNLKLEQMTDEDIRVIGKIDSIEFERMSD
jgi:phytoene desaturase